MVFFLCTYFAHAGSVFNVCTHVGFRMLLSVFTSAVCALALGPAMIRSLQRRQMGQVIRDDGPQSHLSKRGTPTMGGLLIVFSLSCSVLLWGDLRCLPLWWVMGVMWAFALIGFFDDRMKLRRASSDGLAARWKYAAQSAVALLALFWVYAHASHPAETALLLPYIKASALPLGMGFVLLGYFVVVGSSNAVNLTDGLDGLVIVPVIMVAAALAAFAYVESHAPLAQVFHLPFLPYLSEVAMVACAMVGSGVGFLWFNAYPAQVFMGDVGSLALGAGLGMMAVLVRQEILFFVMAGVFVAETLSVILQVASFKMRGKRIFKMAPLHHHFELKGWPESRVTVRFWIVSAVFVLLALLRLTLR
jgi:phospho-N-acetylmuramoyl-pentapeptide-transferase